MRCSKTVKFSSIALMLIALIHLLLIYLGVRTHKFSKNNDISHASIQIHWISDTSVKQPPEPDMMKYVTSRPDLEPVISIQPPPSVQEKNSPNPQNSITTPPQPSVQTDKAAVLSQDHPRPSPDQKSYCVQAPLGNTQGHTLTMIMLIVNSYGHIVIAQISQSSGDSELDQAILNAWSQCSFRPREVEGPSLSNETYFFSGSPSYTPPSGS